MGEETWSAISIRGRHDLGGWVLDRTRTWTRDGERNLSPLVARAACRLVDRVALALTFPERRALHLESVDEAIVVLRTRLRLAEHLGTANIDHRIERRDFSDQDNDAVYPWLGCEIADIDQQDAILVIGSNLRREAPILAHRLRKAALAGASVSFVSGEKHDYFFHADHYLSGAGLVELLSGKGIKPVVNALKKADNALVLLGNIAGRHAAYGAVRALAAGIAEQAGAKLGFISPGANSAGLKTNAKGMTKAMALSRRAVKQVLITGAPASPAAVYEASAIGGVTIDSTQ